MKTYIVILLALLCFGAGIPAARCQDWNPIGDNFTTGKLGVGFSSAPSYDLDLGKTLPYFRIHSTEYTNNPASLYKKGGIIFSQGADKTASVLFAVPPGYHVPGILFATKTSWSTPGSGATDWYNRMFIHPNGNVGIGTTDPNSTLQVFSNNRNFHVNRTIAGSSEESAGGKNYILLHKAYSTAPLEDHLVMGKITGIRGSTASWNRKWTIEVNTASAYTTNRGSIVTLNEGAKLVLVDYQGSAYMAVEILANSSMSYFSFTGYATKEMLQLVYDDHVSNIRPFTDVDPVGFAGKVNITTDQAVAGKPVPVLTLGSPNFAFDKLSGPSLEFSSGISLARVSGVDERNSGNDAYRGALVFQTRYHTAGSDNGFYERMRITASGNVGIGTSTPDHKLTVDGSVKCEEVKVEIIPGTGPDYVFETDYKLLPLAELEAYVNQHKHLPEVPSAKEMETNGLNLKEMNLILLKKVEELTLHLIEQNHINQVQQELNKTLVEEINTLKTR